MSLELVSCVMCQMGDHQACDGELWTSKRECDCAHGYNPEEQAPVTLAEHIAHSIWRDSQLTWGEETIANLIYLEHDLGPERHAAYDFVMASGQPIEQQYSHTPWNGSVRPSMPAFLGLDRDEYTVPD